MQPVHETFTKAELQTSSTEGAGSVIMKREQLQLHDNLAENQ